MPSLISFLKHIYFLFFHFTIGNLTFRLLIINIYDKNLLKYNPHKDINSRHFKHKRLLNQWSDTLKIILSIPFTLKIGIYNKSFILVFTHNVLEVFYQIDKCMYAHWRFVYRVIGRNKRSIKWVLVAKEIITWTERQISCMVGQVLINLSVCLFNDTTHLLLMGSESLFYTSVRTVTKSQIS